VPDLEGPLTPGFEQPDLEVPDREGPSPRTSS